MMMRMISLTQSMSWQFPNTNFGRLEQWTLVGEKLLLLHILFLNLLVKNVILKKLHRNLIKNSSVFSETFELRLNGGILKK